MQKRVKTLSKRHFENNFILYFILSIFFIVGVIIGAILINRLETEQNYKIVGYFSWILDYINHGDQASIDILKSSLFSNMKFSFIIWISGFIVLGTIIIPLIIGLKGISIGFTVGFLVKEFGIKGFTFALLGLLPHYLVILPAILATGSVGLSNSMANSRGRGKTLYRVNQKGIIDYSILILLFLIIIIMGCFVESLITPYFLKLTKFNL